MIVLTNIICNVTLCVMMDPGEKLRRSFLWLTLFSAISRIHVGCIVCMPLCIGWYLHRILDEKKQWQFILAECSIIHVSLLFLVIWASNDYIYKFYTFHTHLLHLFIPQSFSAWGHLRRKIYWGDSFLFLLSYVFHLEGGLFDWLWWS